MISVSVVVFCAVCAPLAASAATIPTVPVGNIGNAPDPLTGNLYGSVSYAYRIGATEVTNEQYAEFLNAKAKSDPLGLFYLNMDYARYGGIRRNGVDGSYVYTTKPNMGNKPVNYVNWFSAIRFANWLHNGKGVGDTETGAYTILGNSALPSEGWNIARNPGAKWFLPSENEWYKAAYYHPAELGGDIDNYWLYATRSNSQPIMATAINASGPNRGDIANPGGNIVNYFAGADWNGLNGNVTTVGSAGPLSQSFYGTSDQSGNVLEWTETLWAKLGVIGSRYIRGGGFGDNYGSLMSSLHHTRSDRYGDYNIGFRVATIVSEPRTLVLAIAAALFSVATLRRFATIPVCPASLSKRCSLARR